MKVYVGITPDSVIILRGSATDAEGRLCGEFIRQVPIGSRYAGIRYQDWLPFVNRLVEIDDLQQGKVQAFDPSPERVR